ncbi:MAG: carboxypeptidase regulatory-like domain-containing protein, partial [Planctomycetota bacterium]
MRPLDDIERSVEELNVTTTSPADERILGDAFAALEEAVVMEDGLIAPAVWQRILRSGIVRAAAAMLVIGGILVCVTVLRPPIVAPPVGAPQPAVTQADLKHIAEMAVAGDVEGLVDVLKDGPFEIKVLAAFCLGEVGDERALPELRRQYLLAEEKLPAGYGKNPFAAPIAEIEKRIRDRQQPALPAVDANVAGRPDVSETFGADANRTGTVVIPPESERALDFLVVHKETGEPIVGARLNIRIKRQGPDETNEAVTGEEGHYRIDIGGEDTNYVRIEVSKEDFVPVRVLFTTQEEAVVPAEYTLELERGSPLGGFIRNEAGEPVEGVTLYVQAWGRPESEVERIFIRDHRETTDANGLWRCDALPARLRSVYVRLTHPDYIDDESYYVRAAPPIELLREMSAVMVMKKGVHVAGGVVDFNGQAVSDADVRQGEATGYGGVDYPSARTGADGKFEFRSTRPGQLTLTVRAKGFAPELKEIAVYEGMRPIEFRLGPAHIIRGRVVDSGDNPIEGVEVSVSNWRGRRSIRWHTRTKAGGYFEWSEAPTDEVIFGFSRKGYIPVANLGLLPSTAEHIIEMYRALRIAGSVVDADTNQRVLEFRLIPGARWREGGRTSWDHDSAKRFEHGRYESTFGKARYGYFIRIEADGYMPAVSRMFTEEEEDVA